MLDFWNSPDSNVHQNTLFFQLWSQTTCISLALVTDRVWQTWNLTHAADLHHTFHFPSVWLEKRLSAFVIIFLLCASALEKSCFCYSTLQSRLVPFVLFHPDVSKSDTDEWLLNLVVTKRNFTSSLFKFLNSGSQPKTGSKVCTFEMFVEVEV